MHPSLTTTLATAIAAGAIAQMIARRLRLPPIFFLLMGGAVLGPVGLGWVDPRLLGPALPPLVHLLVAIVVFEGALSLRIQNYRTASAVIQRLVTLGALVSWIGATAACHYIARWEWGYSLMFGATVVVTGPTVIQPILSRVRLRTPIHAALKWESILIDPIGAVLAVLAFDLVLLFADADRSMYPVIMQFALRTLVGLVMGLGGGWLLQRLLPVLHRWIERDVEITNYFVLAAALALFESSNLLAPDSGLITIVVCGIVVGHSRLEFLESIRHFKGQLSVLAVSFLFVILSADVNFRGVVETGWRGPAVALTCAWVIRPIVVWLAARGHEFTWRDKLYIAWIGPRGIIAAAIASLFAIRIQETMPDLPVRPLKGLVFLTIAITVIIAGLTAGPAARILRTRSEDDRGVVIVGANALAAEIGLGLQNAGFPVRLVDTQAENCARAEARGLPAICATGTNAERMEELGLDRFGALLAATPNPAVNALACQMGRSLFGPARSAQLCTDPAAHPSASDSAVPGLPTLTLTGTTLPQAIAAADAGRLTCRPLEADPDGEYAGISLFRVAGGRVTFATESKRGAKSEKVIGLVYQT